MKFVSYNIVFQEISGEVTNFGVWFSSGMYPQTLVGLQACYIAGIPFFWNTLLGDVVYTGVLFGAFELLQYSFPALRLQEAVS
ncbi:MAG: hypothetical protein LBG96_11490 [Tannerella sp.]|nr:hypothetical protein [Tannerella sp.]